MRPLERPIFDRTRDWLHGYPDERLGWMGRESWGEGQVALLCAVPVQPLPSTSGHDGTGITGLASADGRRCGSSFPEISFSRVLFSPEIFFGSNRRAAGVAGAR